MKSPWPYSKHVRDSGTENTIYGGWSGGPKVAAVARVKLEGLSGEVALELVLRGVGSHRGWGQNKPVIDELGQRTQE